MDAPVPVLVAGGGPAGSVTALLLARHGYEVELVDRAVFPRPKPCGECLNPAGVRLLARLGLLPAVMGTGPVPLEGWELRPPAGPSAVGRFRRPDHALGIDRSLFDHALLEIAVREGVRVREGIRVTGVAPGDALAPSVVHLDGAGPRAARFVVGADGLHSRVSAATGSALPARAPQKASLTWHFRAAGPSRKRGRLVIGQGVTAGLAPIGDPYGDLWNGTLVVSPGAPVPSGDIRSRGWPLFLGLLGSEGPGGSPVRWSRRPYIVEGPWGSGSFHRPTRHPARGPILLVGDAAGYFDPLTGQGIHRALRSAKLAAGVLHAHLCAGGGGRPRPTDLRAAREYGVLLNRWRAPGRRLQGMVEAVVRRRGARALALGTLARVPWATSALVRWTGDRPRTILPSPLARE